MKKIVTVALFCFAAGSASAETYYGSGYNNGYNTAGYNTGYNTAGYNAGYNTQGYNGGGGGIDMPLYPYASNANYCPSGLQPIVVGGVICCGSPNRGQSYQAMMQHPVAQPKPKPRRVVRRVVHKPAPRIACPVGLKGCTVN